MTQPDAFSPCITIVLFKVHKLRCSHLYMLKPITLEFVVYICRLKVHFTKERCRTCRYQIHLVAENDHFSLHNVDLLLYIFMWFGAARFLLHDKN